MNLWNKSSNNYLSIILFIGFLFCFFLPLSTKISNIFLILFLVGVLFLVLKGEIGFNKANVSILKYSTLVLMVPLLLSLFFHGELLKVLDLLGRRVSYLLVPIVFLFFPPTHFLSLRKYSFLGIVYGSLLSSSILLFNNLTKYYATRPLFSIDSDLLNFYYTGFNFTEIIDFHPSYFGMYILFSVSVLLFSRVINSNALRIFIFFFLSLIILFLSSRVILFFYALIVLVYILRSLLNYYGKSKRVVLAFLTVGLIIASSAYLLIKNTYIYDSLTKETIWELSFNVNDKYNSKTFGDSRVARWNVALDLIKDQPIIGYGVGNEKDVLEIGYRNDSMLISAQNRYDAHNLFLGYAIETGIFGLLILVYYIFNSLFLFFKFKKTMYFLFFLSVLGMCLIEDYLNNNAAITFLAYFGNLFLFQTLLVKSNTEDELS